MKRRYIPASLWIGIAVVGATIGIFFLLNREFTDVLWTSFAFGLFSEIVFFGGLTLISYLSNQDKMMLNSGFVTSSALYMIISVVLMFSASQFEEKLRTLLIIEIITTTLALIIIIATITSSRNKFASDNALSHSLSFMQGCENKAFSLLSDDANAEFKSGLNRIHEICKYSDNVGDTSLDYKIRELFGNLEVALNESSSSENADKVANVNKIMVLLESELEKRKSELLASKRGAF